MSEKDTAGVIVVIRHGQTEWSESGQHTGRTDIPLTGDGRRQAERLASRLAGRRFVLVLSSPLVRAKDTAVLAGLQDQTGRGIETDQRMTEWDYGDYEGLTSDEIRRRAPGWTIWTGACPGGETAEEVGARADAVLDRARAALSEGDVALVAHGHFLRVLAARWLSLEPARGRFFLLDPATISELGHEHGTPAIARWNA